MAKVHPDQSFIVQNSVFCKARSRMCITHLLSFRTATKNKVNEISLGILSKKKH